MITNAAIAGLLSGSLAVQRYASRVQNKAGISVRTLADDQKVKHHCGSCSAKGGGATDHPS